MADRTLLVFPPAPGLPSASPFSTKAMILLVMAGLDYEAKPSNPQKAPKKKLPVLIDGGETVPDSGFIRRHVEAKHGHDFDAGLDERERAVAVAMIALAEDRLYFAGMAERWLYKENRGALVEMMKGSGVPAFMAGPVTGLVTRSIRKSLDGQGHGRHSRREGLVIGQAAIDAFAAQLGDRPFLMGEEPTGADASVYPMLLGNIAPSFETGLKHMVEGHANLMAYVERMRARFPLPTG